MVSEEWFCQNPLHVWMYLLKNRKFFRKKEIFMLLWFVLTGWSLFRVSHSLFDLSTLHWTDDWLFLHLYLLSKITKRHLRWNNVDLEPSDVADTPNWTQGEVQPKFVCATPLFRDGRFTVAVSLNPIRYRYGPLSKIFYYLFIGWWIGISHSIRLE